MSGQWFESQFYLDSVKETNGGQTDRQTDRQTEDVRRQNLLNELDRNIQKYPNRNLDRLSKN